MEDAAPISHSLEAAAEGAERVVRCRKCKRSFGPVTRNWKSSPAVIRRVTSLAEARSGIPASEQVEWRQWICPGCAALLDTEAALRGEPDVWDYRPPGC